jgi:hypothetical protein
MLPTKKRILRPRTFKTPEAHADWSKRDDLAIRLETLPRKADLVAWALQGVMALEGNDAV